MELLTDTQLDELLAQWRAPIVPESIEHGIFSRAQNGSWLTLLFRRTIRVPVPVGIAAFALWIAVIAISFSRHSIAPLRNEVTLADFQPVKEVTVKVIRSGI